jgi:hypothetical protein
MAVAACVVFGRRTPTRSIWFERGSNSPKFSRHSTMQATSPPLGISRACIAVHVSARVAGLTASQKASARSSAPASTSSSA